MELSSSSALLQISFIGSEDCTLSLVGLATCGAVSWNDDYCCLRLLPDKHLAASAQFSFACQSKQDGIEDVLIVQLETRDAGDVAIGITILKREISNLGFDK